MKIVIIDDESLARQYVKSCLKGHENIEICAECADGFEGIKAIQEHKPDLIFLDIQMPRINGFEMLELLEEVPSVIFTTAFDEYAMKAFEANAVDYLLKPFNQDRFNKAFSKVKINTNSASIFNESPAKSPEEANRIVLRHQGEIRIIPAADVMYIEAWDDYVKIHTAKEVFVKKKTLSYYE
ncbi:MAG: response regulator, partial [Bacteroidia bacterium]|nr:response regulator [Bacteroidia bacterium]